MLSMPSSQRNDEPLIFVSVDSHTTVPPEKWEEYLEPQYVPFLAELRDEDEVYQQVMGQIAVFPPEVLDVIDPGDAFRSGGRLGVWDRDRRVAEMDREGVAAEAVFPIDHTAPPLFFAGANNKYDVEVRQAGVRAYHRWAADEFGSASDRILVAADAGPCLDIEVSLAETQWAFEHGLHGVMAPGTTGDPALPPPYDTHFDPLWSLYAEAGAPVYVHAGYGIEQGEWSSRMGPVIARMKAAGRSNLLEELIHHTQEEVFPQDLRPRKFFVQALLSGLLDRHPDLKLILCEIRGDWIPATLQRLDAYYEQHRAQLPAKRMPSEYFASNCGVVLSFLHKSEVGMFDQIGTNAIMFGRDYPHPEGTWPNTSEWLRDSLQGVADGVLASFLGENAVRLLGLNREHLAKVASRIGPTVDEITGQPSTVDPRIVHSWHQRGGYLKDVEVVDLASVDRLVEDELPALAVASSGRQ